MFSISSPELYGLRFVENHVYQRQEAQLRDLWVSFKCYIVYHNEVTKKLLQTFLLEAGASAGDERAHVR